jgi:hypothetical protein
MDEDILTDKDLRRRLDRIQWLLLIQAISIILLGLSILRRLL